MSSRSTAGWSPTHILIATGLGAGAHEYSNLGDISMLQAGVARLQQLWPDATLQVLTDSPAALAVHCPGAVAVSAAGKNLWLGEDLFLGRLGHALPKSLARALLATKKSAGIHCPWLLGFLLRLRLSMRRRSAEFADLAAFTTALKRTELVVVCGAGGFFDDCRGWNLGILDLLEAAIRRGIPTAMFGQGLGPLVDPVVLARARRFFPAVELISLRGSRGGRELLESLGVPPSRVRTSGDEAIELAYAARAEEPGRAIGLNLRVAATAATGEDAIGQVRSGLQDFARRQQTTLLPLPISSNPYANDPATIRRLLAGFDDQTDGGLALDTPRKVIQQTSRCRIVVTGAYHAAVFALAQGIPVVALANSGYFANKFLGLEDQFGPGCETLLLHEPDFPQRLDAALNRAWQSADAVRLPLRQAALAQIDAGREAYETLGRLMAVRAA